jgi:dihydroorotate dehydrogenase
MFSLPFDIYPLLRPFLFKIDPEKAHAFAIACMKKGLVPPVKVAVDPVLNANLGTFQLPHPIGLAAGFDKQAEVIGETFELGFSFTEIGGVTPLPQPGNPKPRMFRLPDSLALINRFGFNNVGATVVSRRLAAYRDTQTRSKAHCIGVNLGKNKDTVDAADDYVKGVATFANDADFLTINVSSPNTPGLRNMQSRENLTDLLKRVTQARADSGKNPLLFVKIAPDISEDEAKDIAEVVLEADIDGMIVGNTTTSRPAGIRSHHVNEQGGLSGKPLFDLSTRVLSDIYQLTEGRIPLIGCGGVFTGSDAYTKIRAGASLIQIYTAMIYDGPTIVARIAAELAELLRRDGFSSVSEAVGIDSRKH